MKREYLIQIIREEIQKVLQEKRGAKMKKLYMTIGISGSGKSTYIKKNFKPEIIVSPDSIRKEITGSISDQSKDDVVWGIAKKRTQENLDKYGEALLDATNTLSKYRTKFLKLFSDVEKIGILFEIDPEESKKRIKRDLDAGVDRSDVPDDVIDTQYKDLMNGFRHINTQFDRVIQVK